MLPHLGDRKIDFTGSKSRHEQHLECILRRSLYSEVKQYWCSDKTTSASHLEALRKDIPLVNPKDAKIEELLKENEKLKHRNAKIEELLKENEELKHRNAKLKSYLKKMKN